MTPTFLLFKDHTIDNRERLTTSDYSWHDMTSLKERTSGWPWHNKRHVLRSLCVSNLSRDVTSIDDQLLEKHVETSFILSERMSCYFVDKLFQSFSSIFNEVFLIKALIPSKRHLSLPSLAWKWRNYDLTVSFQFTSKPLKVGVASTDRRFLQFEDRKVRLWKTWYGLVTEI